MQKFLALPTVLLAGCSANQAAGNRSDDGKIVPSPIHFPAEVDPVPPPVRGEGPVPKETGDSPQPEVPADDEPESDRSSSH